MEQQSIFQKIKNNRRKDANGNLLKPVPFFKIEHVFKDEFDTYPEYIKKDYKYDEETRTYYVDNEIWANGWRAHGPYWRSPSHELYKEYTLGGSSVGSLVMGDLKKVIEENYGDIPGTPFKARAELYAEKKGIQFELTETMDSGVFRMGHIEEPSIRAEFPRIFAKDYPNLSCKVINDTMMYGSETIPYAVVNLDGRVIIDGVEGVFEAKTCRFSSHNFDLWKQNVVPLDYFVQCQYYMEVMNLPFTIICVKLGMDDYRYFLIIRDMEICDAVIRACNEFIDCCYNNVEPDESEEDINLINKLWRKRMGSYEGPKAACSLPETLIPVLSQINALNFQIKESEDNLNEMKEQRKALLVEHIFPVFGKNTFGICQGEGFTMKIKLKDGRSYKKTLLEEKLKEQRPDLYEEYTEMVPVFNKSRFKKEAAAEYNDFVAVNTELTEGKENFCEIEVVENTP